MNFIRKKISLLLEKIWYEKNHKPLVFYLLLPFSYIYRVIIFFRHLFYKLNIFKIHNFPCPIIVVGNITVGGTGKTPLVIWLTQYLKKAGYKPAIITRGYQGKIKNTPHLVVKKDLAQDVGDEAKLLFLRCQCPVMVGANRVASVTKLLTDTNCNIIISDDGLQHYALGRNLEIAIIDSSRHFGNGFCLPAGPLREPISRLEKVDHIVTNNNSQEHKEDMQTLMEGFYNLTKFNLKLSEEKIHELKNQTVHAIAGIGNPERFFALLKTENFNIIPHPFPDHYQFTPKDFSFKDSYPIIMTEKDAVKCLDLPLKLRKRCYVLKISAHVKNPQKITNLIKSLQD